MSDRLMFQRIIEYRGLSFASLVLVGFLTAAAYAETYDVKKYGAVGDGTTIDSPAVNKAVEAAAAVGGGTVYFPAGTYACYSIRLKSNIALHLDQGATILAASPGARGGYDPAEANEWGDQYRYQDFGHSHWHNSLIWGENLENISIYGPGLIHGKGLMRGEPADSRARGTRLSP